MLMKITLGSECWVQKAEPNLQAKCIALAGIIGAVATLPDTKAQPNKESNTSTYLFIGGAALSWIYVLMPDQSEKIYEAIKAYNADPSDIIEPDDLENEILSDDSIFAIKAVQNNGILIINVDRVNISVGDICKIYRCYDHGLRKELIGKAKVSKINNKKIALTIFDNKCEVTVEDIAKFIFK